VREAGGKTLCRGGGGIEKMPQTPPLLGKCPTLVKGPIEENPTQKRPEPTKPLWTEFSREKKPAIR